MRIQHKDTGRTGTLLDDLGDRLLVHADPTHPTIRPGAARPAEQRTWRRVRTTVLR